MLITNIIDGSFDLISQLQFYCQSFTRHIGVYQKQEIIELIVQQRYEQLVNHIASLYQNDIWDHKQQVAKILIEQCYLRTSRRQLLFRLIENRLIDLDVRLDSYGRTLLHMSAYYLDVELVKILTANNVGVRLRDYAGNTALHIAIQSYRNGTPPPESSLMVKKNLSKVISLLLNADKSSLKYFLTIKDTNNNNLNGKSISSLHKLSYRIPQNKTSSDCPIVDKINTKRVESIMQPDYSTSLINTKNAFGRTALHYCALSISEKDLTHFIELLLDNGANPDAIDAKMRTPFYCLMQRSDITDLSFKLSSMRTLLAHGCDDLGLALSFDDQLLNPIEPDRPIVGFRDNVNNVEGQHLRRDVNSTTTIETKYRRTPDLKHLARQSINTNRKLLSQATKNSLPSSLIIYLERQLISQSDFT